jgi:hypothetical protein
MIPNLVFAQEVLNETRTVSCVNKENIYKLLGEFDEVPLIRALNSPVLGVPIFNSLVIFINQKTGSFTVVEKVEEQKYCILAMGTNFEPMPAEALKEYNKFREKENKKKL